jgi:predicted ATPase
VRQALLQSDGRLITLTGAGGCGKTRLALEVAADLVDFFGEGVWLVELAPIADPARLTEAVAGPLGVHDQPGRTMLDALLSWLKRRQLRASCRCLSQPGPPCPQRLPRRAPARDKPRVASGGGRNDVASAVLSRATRRSARAVRRSLWAAPGCSCLWKAREVQRACEVTPENAPTVVHICRQLDGMPLALELAAAWVRVRSIREIAGRLDQSFALLTGGSRSAPRRHRTRRATLDWSHTLLSPLERAVFRRLSVFAGRFTVEAAEAVCANGGIAQSDVLHLLTALVDKSLVLTDEHPGEMRHRMLEPVRQYAFERLSAACERLAVDSRHAAYHLDLSEQASQALWAPHTTRPFVSVAQIRWQTQLTEET